MGGKGSGRHKGYLREAYGDRHIVKILQLIKNGVKSRVDYLYKVGNCSYKAAFIGNYRVILGINKASLSYKYRSKYEVERCSIPDCRFIFILLVKRRFIDSILLGKVDSNNSNKYII